LAELIKPWIMNIVFAIFFLIISDIMLPEGHIKQYIKVILGLFVLLAIIKPFIEMKHINNYFENTYIETSSFLETNPLANDFEVLNTYHKEKVIDIYENNIKKMVLNTIAQEKSIDEDSIVVELEIEKSYESPDFGSLKHIIVTMPDKNGDLNIQNIKKVRILRSKDVIYKDEKEYNFNDKTSTEELKNKLSKLLYINEKNIQIRLTIDNK
jgi:stage III sporulation protein AF